jgi:predicted nucleic acid-binding Zn ribbon protein
MKENNGGRVDYEGGVVSSRVENSYHQRVICWAWVIEGGRRVYCSRRLQMFQMNNKREERKIMMSFFVMVMLTLP